MESGREPANWLSCEPSRGRRKAPVYAALANGFLDAVGGTQRPGPGWARRSERPLFRSDLARTLNRCRNKLKMLEPSSSGSEKEITNRPRGREAGTNLMLGGNQPKGPY